LVHDFALETLLPVDPTFGQHIVAPPFSQGLTYFEGPAGTELWVAGNDASAGGTFVARRVSPSGWASFSLLSAGGLPIVADVEALDAFPPHELRLLIAGEVVTVGWPGLENPVGPNALTVLDESLIEAQTISAVSAAGGYFETVDEVASGRYEVRTHDASGAIIERIPLDADFTAPVQGSEFVASGPGGLPATYVVAGDQLYEFVTRRSPVDSGGHAEALVYSTTVATAIPPCDPTTGAPSVTSIPLMVPVLTVFDDVNVRVEADSADWGQLEVELIAPLGVSSTPLLFRPILDAGPQALWFDDPGDVPTRADRRAALDSLAWNNLFGEWQLRVTNFADSGGSVERFSLSFVTDSDPTFVRGDANCSGVVDIDDVVYLVTRLGQEGIIEGGALEWDFCLDAMDIEDDGDVDWDDAVLLHTLLTADAQEPLNPDCVVDETPDSIDCQFSPSCP
ncbi:MAG: hypothetical protein KDC38_10850, partial [Planctomycetes bacterium]|nr:hypothetical protein [Planctomycetota bacterium]